MKIVNVTPGLLPIPPNGWGAVEKIIWETHKCLIQIGYDSEILYLNDVSDKTNIVHIHVANLANEAHSRGIPYYFTMHDHHAYLYGKDSHAYKENLEAIRNAKKAFVPAKYLVEWFDGIPEYFSHGVNTDYFTVNTTITEHKLLCVANNGFIHDQSEDRKGFGFAIEAAKRLGLPITIVGPINNKKYFEKFPPNYNKVNIVYDVSEDELKKIYSQHTIFLHPSILEAGHPNLTLLEAMASGLPVLATFEDNNDLKGLIKIQRDTDSIIKALTNVFSNYEQYKKMARHQAELLSWKNRTEELLKIYGVKNENIKNMKQQMLHHYNSTTLLHKESKKYKPNISFNNIDGSLIEITGQSSKKYKVEFIDNKTKKILYGNEMNINCWSKCSIKYFIDWNIKVYENDTLIEDYYTDFKDKTVYIAIDSKSLGDTIAWFPYVNEFGKKHGCKLICSTFWNDFFETEYPHIKFIKPGEVANGIAAMYTVGLFYKQDGNWDESKHPSNPLSGPMQKISSDILGLEYQEVKPIIKKLNKTISTDSKQICIAPYGSAQSKFWNNPTGWQEVIDWLNENGYKVKLISKEENGYMGNPYLNGVEKHPDGPIELVMDEMLKSKAVIGIGSGLSWLSWAIGVPTILISGFSYDWAEMKDCIRISAPIGKCEGCFNRKRLDAGDWNWCPDHKGTDRQFECTKTISSKDVIEKLKKLIV